MPDKEKKDKLGRKMKEIEEDLRNKAMKVAYEISEDVESYTKVKLTFEQFDKMFEKMRELVFEGYSSAIKFMVYAGGGSGLIQSSKNSVK